MHPYVEFFWLCYLAIESPSFAHICFSFVSLSLILAKCLIHLKTLQGNFGNLTNLEVHVFSYLKGYENKGLGGVYESELETSLLLLEINLAPN